MNYILIGILGVVLLFFAFSSFTSKKKKRLEKEKRQKEVKEVIKQFMRQQLQLQHKNVIFDQVVARNSKEFRYRDVFDVIVKLYDSKKNDLYATKAFEVEGFTKSIGKKEYETIWQVNCELDLDNTLSRIKIQKKGNKLKRKDPEAKQQLIEARKLEKEQLADERKKAKEQKQKIKNYEKPKTPLSEKFGGFKDSK